MVIDSVAIERVGPGSSSESSFHFDLSAESGKVDVRGPTRRRAAANNGPFKRQVIAGIERCKHCIQVSNHRQRQYSWVMAPRRMKTAKSLQSACHKVEDRVDEVIWVGKGGDQA